MPDSQTSADACPATTPDRHQGLPVVFLRGADGVTRPAPFLLNRSELIDFFRLQDSGTKFPDKTIQRYRKLGLKSIRVGRRVWYRLDDVLTFLDQQQQRIAPAR